MAPASEQRNIRSFFSRPASSGSPSDKTGVTNAIPESPKKASPSRSPTPESEERETKKARTVPSEEGELVEDKPLMAQKSAGTVGTVEATGAPEILYLELTDTFEKVEQESGRLATIAIVSSFFLKVLQTNANDLPMVTYLFINRLGPDYEGLELGLGESLIIKALSEATGSSIQAIKQEYKKVGDLGKVAQASKSSQRTMIKPKPLTIATVFNGLSEIAKSTGQSSQSKKIGIIRRMLAACQGSEPKFLVRSIEGKLRIGMAEKTVLVALAQAFVNWEKSKGKKSIDSGRAEDILKEAFSQLPNYEVLISAMIAHGIEKLPENCKIAAGIPVRPMLAKPTKSISEILDRFHGEKFTCEYKYDGERAQIHGMSDGTVKVYSRNMEDMSQRYPDIISIVPKIQQAAVASTDGHKPSFIIDCEAVAWDRKNNKILPFQVLSTRKRKGVDESSITVRVCLFAFDLLLFDNVSYLARPLRERRELLKSHFALIPGEFQMAQHMDSDNTEDIQAFLDQSVHDACEGLMVKTLEGEESGYEPSKRSRNWLKLKKDYLSGVGDSLDLVVLGAYYGRGKRTNFYGGFLLGCYNADTEEYETICKIGTGFSEENLESFYNTLSKTVTEVPKSYYSYDRAPSSLPDVWFEPTTVWEVLTADLSLSPIYKAGSHELERGVSLRFPRFIRVRDDKGVTDATTSEQVVQFYERQTALAQGGGED